MAAVAAAALIALVAGLFASARSTASSKALSIRGADVSFTLQEEAVGNFVAGPNGRAPIERVLAGYGANTVRIRLWVEPPFGTSDLASALTLGRRAAAAGMHIVLALHYSDTWADHSNQPTPAAWRAMELDELASAVQTYTQRVVAAFVDQGTPPIIVQIGNEIDNGLLWPVGRLDNTAWDAVARLVGAGAEGARSGAGAQPPRIMIHLAASEDPTAVTRFIDELGARGIQPDVLGLSYYPWWSGSLNTLERTLDVAASQLGLDVLLAETGYPWTLADGDDTPNAVRRGTELPDGADYPATPKGQADWAEVLRVVLQRVPHGRGLGMLFWEPGWLPGVEAAAGVGTSYDNTTLFRWDGTPLPALAALRPQNAPSGS